MPEIAFPLTTAPGLNPTESGGRLINSIVEKAPDGSRSRFIWRRSAGLIERFVTEEGHRGSLLVGTTLYVVSGDTVYSVTKSGSTYTATALTGDPVGGDGKVTLDRNMNSTPQVLIEHSAGISQINTGAGTVSNFTDADLPAINSICFVGGYFMPSIGDGRTFASGLNAVTFAAADFTRAEQSPDGLVRNIRYGRDLAMMGVSSIEFWGNVGKPTGFPFQFSSVIPVGLLTKHAVAGFELGFTEGIVFVASDRTVRKLAGYSAEVISTPDLNKLIEEVADVSELEMSVFVANGHSYAVLSSATWSWLYAYPDRTTPGGWSELVSYGETRWRAMMGVNAFDEWLVFDQASDQVYRVDRAAFREGENPLVWEMRSAQIHAFPSPIEINRASFDFMTGIGLDAGIDPIETNPRVLIDYSDDGGVTWSVPDEYELGTQGEVRTVDCWLQGTTKPQGRQYRLKVSDPREVALFGGAWDGRVVA